MRVLATLKVCFKALRVQWKSMLLMYSIFPLIMCLFMGYTQKDLYRPDTNIEKINVSFNDKDNSDTSRALIKLFETKDLKKLFTIKKDSDYTIVIPKGYEKNLSQSKNVNIDINANKDNSNSGDIIIKSVLNEYGKGISQSSIISNKIEELSINDKEKIYKNVSEEINKASEKTAIQNKILNGQKTLTANENEAASMASYMIFMIILSFSASHNLEKENGTFKRFLSTPITRLSYFNLDLFSFFITGLMCGGLYLITMRVFNIGFIGTNPFLIIFILIAQSILSAAIGGLLIAFLNKTVSTAIMLVLMYFEVIFGGAFIPSKEFTNSVLVTLSKVTPGTVITKAYKYSILFNSFDKIIGLVLIMLVTSVIVYLISIIKVKISWEE